MIKYAALQPMTELLTTPPLSYDQEARILLGDVNLAVYKAIGLHALSVAVDSSGQKIASGGHLIRNARPLWSVAHEAALATLRLQRSVRFKEIHEQFAGFGLILPHAEGALGVLVTECYGGLPEPYLVRTAFDVAKTTIAENRNQ